MKTEHSQAVKSLANPVQSTVIQTVMPEAALQSNLSAWAGCGVALAGTASGTVFTKSKAVTWKWEQAS